GVQVYRERDGGGSAQSRLCRPTNVWRDGRAWRVRELAAGHPCTRDRGVARAVNGLTHGIRIVAKKHAGSPDDAGPAGAGSAAPFVPETRSVRTLAAAAQQCRGCDLYKNATQVVFGAGPSTASVMFVGEQPGDQEDRQGEPFVGPAGALLDKALEDAGIPRAHVYVTNAVKHFKWEPRGKRRIHKKPRASEI